MAYVPILVLPLQYTTETLAPTRKAQIVSELPLLFKAPLIFLKAYSVQWKKMGEGGGVKEDESHKWWPAAAPHIESHLYVRLSITEHSHLGYQISSMQKKSSFFYPYAISGSYQFRGQFNCTPSFTLVQSFVRGRLSALLNYIVHSRPKNTFHTLWLPQCKYFSSVIPEPSHV